MRTGSQCACAQILRFSLLHLRFFTVLRLAILRILSLVLPDSRYQLRRNNNGILLERPRLRTKKTMGDRALSMAAPFLWNSLPLSIRQETSIDSFKLSVKTHLFKKAFSQIIYSFNLYCYFCYIFLFIYLFYLYFYFYLFIFFKF